MPQSETPLTLPRRIYAQVERVNLWWKAVNTFMEAVERQMRRHYPPEGMEDGQEHGL